MSMERAIRRNAERADPFEDRRILPATFEQRQLTEKWILPYSEALVNDVEKLRMNVDRTLQKDPETRARMKFWDKRYPEGLCGEVRNAVFEEMETGMMDRGNPGLQALKNFVREGGVMKRFWGIDKGIYFQNAIQIGNSILDVANDTVDVTKPPVVFYPSLDEAPIQNIKDLTEFADVAEKYWGADVYPNIYLPQLAPLFPVLSIHPAKGADRRDTLRLENDALGLEMENITALRDSHMFGLSSDFLFKSPYSDKRLSDDMLERLFDSSVIKRLQSFRPGGLFDVTANPEIAQNVIGSFHYDKDMSEFPESYASEIREMERGGRVINGIPLVSVKK